MPGEVDNIIELLGPQEVIGRAIEILMARDDVSRDAAFALLVHTSSGSHRKLRETATEIIQQRNGD